ncbi:MAG: type II/IV secretion system protein, partial [Chloroflexi bacterium]|nr:type II/IV secretion system protein [Chloroflexota bacterium]
LKVLAKLNPTERRHPQDGQFSTKVDEQRLDIRLATAESIHGETAVLRLLNRAGSLLSLPDLGFAPGTLERHQRMLRHPFGMVLIAGPTGAGKTTTLYASLGQLDRAERNIVTIEDPVEYRFEGITQLQVSQRHGISFATGLRAIMRMDPDVIMVGEIRDGETAQIAVQAALTGHLVLSSIHANDAAGAIFRLLNLGADTFMVSAALLGVVAQRMVRKVCPYCAKEQEADAESQALFAEVLQEQRSVFKQGAGCSMCTGTGYRGRTGIFELLETSETLEEMLLARAPAAEIRRQAIAKGMVTMLQDGMRKAAEGVTTPAEVVRHVYSAAGSRRT